MKKIGLYLFIALVLLSINITNVKAIDASSCFGKTSECAVCIYEGNVFEIRFLVEKNGSNISYTKESYKKNQSDPYGFEYKINNDDFLDDNILKCPTELKFTQTSKPQDRSATMNISFETGTSKINLSNKSVNTVNNQTSSNSNNNTSSSSSNTSNSNTSSNSSNTTNNNRASNSNTNNYVDGEKVEGCNILGDRFLKYAKSALFWLQIFVPILALILTMIDLVKAILAADEDAKKKAVKSTKTRIIAAVIIELLPAIILIILSIADFTTGSACVNTFIGK